MFLGFGDLSPLTLLETQLAMIMAIFGRMHAAYMMGVIASLFAFGVNKKTKYYDESKRLKIGLSYLETPNVLRLSMNITWFFIGHQWNF